MTGRLLWGFAPLVLTCATQNALLMYVSRRLAVADAAADAAVASKKAGAGHSARRPWRREAAAAAAL